MKHKLATLTALKDECAAVLTSLSRTWRVVVWALSAATAYAWCLRAQDSGFLCRASRLALLHEVWAQRLLDVCRANGGVYVKAGQFAAAFAGVPPEYRRALAQLQDRASPRPFSTMCRTLAQELGTDVDEVFERISQQATAAASLAQVHRARLRRGGADVALKVQYPGLQREASLDLATLRLLNGAAARAFPRFSLGWLFEELRVKLIDELDFRREIGNSQRLAALLAPSHRIATPAILAHLSSSRLLVMEWVDGIKVDDRAALEAAGIRPREVALSVEKAFADMTFRHGFLHADPHPGNIFVRPSGHRRGPLRPLRTLLRRLRGGGRPYEVVFLDHGSYLELSEHLRGSYCQLWAALAARDAELAAAIARAVGGGARAGAVLPVVLTQPGHTTEEREQMQAATGVGTLGDMMQLLSAAPRDVVELLRITAVVRSVTNRLGCRPADQLHINARCALEALRQPTMRGMGAAPIRLRARIKAHVTLALCRGLSWVVRLASLFPF